MICKNSSLCVFDKPGVLTDIQRAYTVEYYPLSSISSKGPIEFHVPGNAEDYIDVNDVKLYVQLRVKKADGTDIDQTKDIVGFNNLPIVTLFQDASLMIGESQIEGGHMNYPYFGYFNTVMQFTPSAQQSQLQSYGWFKDQAGKFDDASNTGFKRRQSLVGNSSLVELMGPLYFDFFNQDRFLISHTDMRIKLLPNKTDFVLNSYATKLSDYKIDFEKVILLVDRVELNPSVINGHALGLKTRNAHYFLNHSELLTYTIPKGQRSYTKDRLFPDMAPKMLMIAMVENDAYNGDLSKNPFNFKHFDLNKIALYREGRSVPGQPITPDFTNKQYLRSYNLTMRSFDYYNTDDTNGLTPFEWANGYTIYAFDLTGDKDVSTDCVQANLSRNLRLELSFANDLPTTINVLIYAVINSEIEITQLRDVITHYNR